MTAAGGGSVPSDWTRPITVDEMYGDWEVDWDDAMALTDVSLDPRPRTSILDNLASLAPDAGPSRRAGLLAAPTVVVGLAFAAPFLYLGYRSFALGGDLWGELTSTSTWRPFRPPTCCRTRPHSASTP